MAVAQRMGITERRYWEIENGYTQPSDAERARLAKVLKTSEGALPWAAMAQSA